MATLPKHFISLLLLLLFVALFMLMINLNNSDTAHIDIRPGGKARRQLLTQDDVPLEPERSGPSPGAGHDVQGSWKTKIGIMIGKQDDSSEPDRSGPSPGAGHDVQGGSWNTGIGITTEELPKKLRPSPLGVGHDIQGSWQAGVKITSSGHDGPLELYRSGHDVQDGSKNVGLGITSRGHDGPLEPEKSGPSPGAGHDIQGSWKSRVRITSSEHDESLALALHKSVPSPGIGHGMILGSRKIIGIGITDGGPTPGAGHHRSSKV